MRAAIEVPRHRWAMISAPHLLTPLCHVPCRPAGRVAARRFHPLQQTPDRFQISTKVLLSRCPPTDAQSRRERAPDAPRPRRPAAFHWPIIRSPHHQGTRSAPRCNAGLIRARWRYRAVRQTTRGCSCTGAQQRVYRGRGHQMMRAPAEFVHRHGGACSRHNALRWPEIRAHRLR